MALETPASRAPLWPGSPRGWEGLVWALCEGKRNVVTGVRSLLLEPPLPYLNTAKGPALPVRAQRNQGAHLWAELCAVWNPPSAPCAGMCSWPPPTSHLGPHGAGWLAVTRMFPRHMGAACSGTPGRHVLAETQQTLPPPAPSPGAPTQVGGGARAQEAAHGCKEAK